VSHGCVRVSNAAASVLQKLAPVGTPVRIRP
jgi:lipoprotein-anchoring transpeptidase ErfK/SrfK